MSQQLGGVRWALGDIATSLSIATDDLYTALSGASVDDQREMLRQCQVNVAEAWRHTVAAYGTIRGLIRDAELELEQLAADERSAEDEPPASF